MKNNLILASKLILMKILEQITWKGSTYAILLFILGIIVGFLFNKVNSKIESINKTQRFEIVTSNSRDSSITQMRLDSLNSLRLENTINSIEKKNDGRFEVLTWSSVLVITLLLAFITINFIVSAAKVKEVVDFEIDKRSDEITKRLNLQFDNVEKLVNKISNIAIEAEEKLNEINSLLARVKSK
jgi:uncharacterized membrane protein YjfL (UPF0719 family)